MRGSNHTRKREYLLLAKTRALLLSAGATPARAAWHLALLLAALTVTIVILASLPASAKDAPPPLAPVDSAVGDTILLEGKVVYVDFWASWCPPCRHSFPWMKDLGRSYAAKGLQIVTINLDKDRAAAEKFLGEINAGLPVIFDPDGSLAKRFHVEAMPTSFLYGRDGVLRERYQGFRAEDTTAVDSLIEVLLNEEVRK